ncbi:MAG: flagellar hook-length control protein FliK, partial [Dongiaceae bacterium]
MSVAPDLLLKAAPEVKPKTPAAKAPARTAEPRQNEASSFAQVYAKERQAKPVERSDAPAKSTHAKPSEADCEEEPSAVAADGQPVLADSGNPLPSDPGELDPLLLMAMAGQLPAEGEPSLGVEATAEGEAELGVGAELALPATAGVNSAAPATLTEASRDPTLEMLNSLPGVRLALGQSQAQGPQEHPAADNAAPPTANAAQNFAGVQAAFAERKLAGAGNELAEGELGEAELPLGELTAPGLDSLQEGSAETRADNFASKLGALSQAIAPQGSSAQRAALIPGQPVPMQQGGWSEAVVDRVMWLSSQNLKSAEIQLDPAELGRLEVRVHMTQDQTQVTFASPNANVRDALEGQMHRLRELFAQQGMS